jgi:hypothetical protein
MSSSDKENTTPPEQHEPRMLASQVALRQKLGERSNTQYYDPFQPKDKVRDIMHEYRRLQQEANGSNIP